MKTTSEKKNSLKKELKRVSKLLNKRHQVSFSISWNRKRKHNLIQTKDIDQLKENGPCILVGIVYFTIAGKQTLLMGQMMLLLDSNGKEISCTSFFIKKKRVVELSYAWEDGMKLLSISINDCISDSNRFIITRV